MSVSIQIRAMLLVSAACLLSACGGGGQQVTPSAGAGSVLTPSSIGAPRTAASQNEQSGENDGDNGGKIAYNGIPNPVSSNIKSTGFECCLSKELGEGLNLVRTGKLNTVSVVMNSWACQIGNWSTGDCVTAPGATFTHPITANVYAVSGTSGVGALLATRTQTFVIRYRPSGDPVRCATGPTDSKYFSVVDQKCVHGLAQAITFNFPNPGVTLPSKIIVGIAYNTSTQGYAPIGTSTACFLSTTSHCGYDSLNISSSGNGGPVGSIFDPGFGYANYSPPGYYCTAGPFVFRADLGCPTGSDWNGLHSQFKVTVRGGDNDGDERRRDRD